MPTADDEEEGGEVGPEFDKAAPAVVLKNPTASGEEQEITKWEGKSKLYVYNVDEKDWNNKGTGSLKLNTPKETPNKARLVMRAEGVGTLLLNSWMTTKPTLKSDKELEVVLAMDGKLKRALIKTRDAAGLCNACNSIV